MNNKEKGFTIIEIIATITILAIISVTIIFSVNNVLQKSHQEYYDAEEKMIVAAAKTYFSDYKSKLPKVVGQIEKVTLQTLITEKYIDPVYDHKKNSCNYNDSFAYAQKADEENYHYYVLLICPSNKTKKDDTLPVISFNPNKKVSNKDIHVTMKITDNQQVASYRYLIMKNNEESRDSSVIDYKEDPVITLTEDGIYQIIGYAYDTSGNMSSKTSGIYEIKKTGPNCNNIKIVSDKPKEQWQTGKVNLKIQVPEDTYKWTWATRNALNITSSTAYGKKKQYLGVAEKNIVLTKDGKNQGQIILYDKVGNTCTKETDKYYLWNLPPTFNDFTITSTIKEYNAITTKLLIAASNPPGLPMQMYISNQGFETGGSWETYASTKNWNVGGSLDGGTRTVYITIRDSLGNKKNVKKTYKVYHECQNLKADAAIYGPCSEPCRETWITGTQSVTIHNRDKLTNKICRTDKSTQSCNTQMCCSSVNYSAWSGCSAACASGGVAPTKTRTAESRYKPGRMCATSDNGSIQLTTTSGCQTDDCCNNVYQAEVFNNSQWSSCKANSGNCGAGKQTRPRVRRSNYDHNIVCGIENETQECDAGTCSMITLKIGDGDTICPSDMGWKKHGRCEGNKDADQFIISDVKPNGNTVSFSWRVYANADRISASGMCPGRKVCIAKKGKTTCYEHSPNFGTFSVNGDWTKPGEGKSGKGTFTVNSNWDSGDYSLIVAANGPCTENEFSGANRYTNPAYQHLIFSVENPDKPKK